MEIHSSRPFLGDDTNAVYRLLGSVPVTHCVDVGAAGGATAAAMKRFAPNCTVDAFEPFPGNIPIFQEKAKDLSGVKLHRAAVSATPGVRKLHVGKAVEGTEPGWEKFVGYSSGSKLSAGGTRFPTIDVDAVRLDDVVQQRISFLKIDVQGTELDVLESARGHFSRRDVDMCFVEFSGETGIPAFFSEFNFRLFYAPLLLAGAKPIAETIAHYDVVRIKQMSNGYTGECIWDGSAPTEAHLFCDHLKRMNVDLKRSVQTDLICVAPHFMPDFLNASAKLFRQTLAK